MGILAPRQAEFFFFQAYGADNHYFYAWLNKIE